MLQSSIIINLFEFESSSSCSRLIIKTFLEYISNYEMRPAHIINVPNTIRKIIAVYYEVGLWNNEDGISVRGFKVQLFHIVYYIICSKDSNKSFFKK